MASYQLGSNRNDFGVKFFMTKTIRKMVQEIGLEGLSIPLLMLCIPKFSKYKAKSVRRGRTVNVTHRKPRTNRPWRKSRALLGVSGLKQSWIGIAKTIKSRRAVLTAWATKTRMKGRGLRDPKPQHRTPGTAKFQYVDTGLQGNQRRIIKTAPHTAQRAIMNLQKTLVRVPGPNTRRYWNNNASFIRVAEIG